MNDVIVEYNRAIYFNTENMINKIVDTFTPTHDGAMYDNAFAYQIDGGQFGKVTSDKSGERNVFYYCIPKCKTSC